LCKNHPLVIPIAHFVHFKIGNLPNRQIDRVKNVNAIQKEKIMKKLMIFLTVSSLICGIALASGNGAVKAPLVDREGGAEVGFLVATVAATPKANIEISVKAGEPDTEYDVWVKVNGVNLTWPGDPSATLSTNKQGNGNVHVVITPEDVAGIPIGDTVDITVVVKKPEDKNTAAKGLVGTAEDVVVK
jgi:hypothetical protein